MRVPFWPRKNARLERRLNTVIEKSEEVRKSIKTPPSRVVIDTSYVEHQLTPARDAVEHPEADGDTAGEDLLWDNSDGLPDQASDFEAVARQAEAGDAGQKLPGRQPRIATRAQTPEEELAEREAQANAEEWAALQEAEDYREYIMRLEEETVREEELRKAAEAKLAEAARLEAEAQQALEALRQLAIERQQAEENERRARDRALAAQREAAVQRKRAEELEAELELQMADREAVTVEAQAAEARVAALQDEISKVQNDTQQVEDLRRREAEINERKEAAEEDLRAQAQRVSSLESEIKREREQRLRMELQRDATLARVREAERRVEQLRQSTSQMQEELQRQADARAEIEAREAEAKKQRSIADLLAAQVDQSRCLMSGVSAEVEAMEAEAAAVESELVALESLEQNLISDMTEARSAGREDVFDQQELAETGFNLDAVAADVEQAEHAAPSGEEADGLVTTAREQAESIGEEAGPQATNGIPAGVETQAENEKPEIVQTSVNPAQERLQQAIVRQLAQPTTSRHGVVQTKAKPQKKVQDIDLAAAASVNSPVPLRVKSLALPEVPQPAAKETPKAPAPDQEGAGTKAGRRDRRVAEQKPATLWQERMGEPLNCVIRDKSASGAMLEIMPNKFGGKSHSVAVGDRYTLTIQVARERSFVTCEVMRVEGRRCGVRFCGPFRTEIMQKARAKPAKGRSSLLG